VDTGKLWKKVLFGGDLGMWALEEGLIGIA